VTQGWTVERRSGRAADLHARTVPDDVAPAVWWLEVERPAIVLGSTQREEVVDLESARRLGLEVARRRSGGGAVLLVPGEATWIDVVLPASHPAWVPDVVRSSAWLGAAWRRVLEQLGVPGGEVHDGPLLRSRWSDLVCFAGLGPGEVTVGGAKVVGISQRRTRHHARFQCVVHHRWDPATLVGALRLPAEEAALAADELAGAAMGIGPIDPELLVTSLLAALPPA
jgi:lipoate-protein ligase A